MTKGAMGDDPDEWYLSRLDEFVSTFVRFPL